MKKTIFSLILIINMLNAKAISLANIFDASFGKGVTVLQKSMTLKSKEIKSIQKLAKAKIDSKKIRFYLVKKSNKVLGYGVLLTQIVRTKKASILYLIDKRERIKSVEIVSFKEPLEYKPNGTWMRVFNGKKSTDNLVSGNGIPTISGATMSARAISDASRIALAIVAKEKNRY